jgi:hypothetical protein
MLKEGLRLSHRKLAQAEVEGESGNFKAMEVLGNTQAMEEAIRIASEAGDLTVDDVLTGRSRVAAINGLEHLTKAGILTRHRNQRKGDSWEAKELFTLLDSFEATVKRS